LNWRREIWFNRIIWAKAQDTRRKAHYVRVPPAKPLATLGRSFSEGGRNSQGKRMKEEAGWRSEGPTSKWQFEHRLWIIWLVVDYCVFFLN